jgi:carboxyl-terminal processing protease
MILLLWASSITRHFVFASVLVRRRTSEDMNHVSPSFARRSIAAVLLLGLAISIATSGTSRSLSPKEREEVFETVWKNIDEHYYDPKFGGVNWQEIHQRYLPLVQAAKDDRDFYSIVDRMTGELHDAHTRFTAPEQWANRKKHQGVSVGFRAVEVEGKIVVLDVFPDSNAARAGIEPGLIVTALDGHPMDERLSEAAKTVMPYSTERATKLRILSSVFSSSLETPFAATLERGDGSSFEVKFARQTLSAEPRVSSAKLSSGFGYIRFDEFHPSLVKDFRTAVENLRDTPGLILDLRRNRGGVGATLEAMANLFFDRKTLFERRMSRKQVTAAERDGHQSEEKEFYVGKSGGQIYSGAVVILETEYSASATEVFSAGMQDSGRAKVVGSPSCGCVLGITHERVMKGGGVLEISEVLWFSPKDRKLEGEGVIPDKVTVPTIRSLQDRRDVVLEEGEKMLQGLTAAQRAVASN